MASASWALQQAVHQALTADAALSALLGGPHVYDHVPRGQAYPYVTFGVTTERDWSTGSDDGGEHILTLHVWSGTAGRRQTDDIAEAMRGVLHDQPIALAGHRLVNLREELFEARRDVSDELYHGVVRFRAVTERIG